ncbi:hypothetical protein [Amycolatopsis sp. YIM 10]|nr:hypothetical protein [Amycolatopsis sp. YIM 10]
MRETSLEKSVTNGRSAMSFTVPETTRFTQEFTVIDLGLAG